MCYFELIYESIIHNNAFSSEKVHLLFVSRIKVQSHISLELFWSEQMYLLIQTRTLYHWGRVIMDYELYCILVKNVLMLDLFQLLMLSDGLECCDVFIRLSFWRHPFTSIAETLMQKHISTILMKKHLRWPEGEHIYRYCPFLSELFLTALTTV